MAERESAARAGMHNSRRCPTVHGQRFLPHFFAGTQVAAAVLSGLLALLLGARCLLASDQGVIRGTVAGISGNPIPGAKVMLAAADGQRQSVTTDQQGHYLFSSIKSGTYTVFAEAAGYRGVSRCNVAIAAGTSSTEDLLLTPVGAAETHRAGSAAPPPAYYDDGQLKASGVKTTSDAAGYSSQAQSPRRLLTEGPGLAGAAAGEQRQPDSADLARELQRVQGAAQNEPSEKNLFDLGNDLLLSEQVEPALKIFQRGVALYPDSTRLRIGLGVALDSRGSYEAAIEALCRASDLNPSDPQPYVFLGKVYHASTPQAGEVAKRMKRFMETNPANALAYYYGALVLWRTPQAGDRGAALEQVEALLRKSLALDPELADAHRQLGTLYGEQHREAEAIKELETAVRLKPLDPDAHYGLAQAYFRAGSKERAQRELQLYDEIRKSQEEGVEKARRTSPPTVTRHDDPRPTSP